MGEIGRKQRRALENILSATDGAGMYPGLPADMVSRKATGPLYRAGLIAPYIPHNPVHKERWTITQRGRAALEQGEPGKGTDNG